MSDRYIGPVDAPSLAVGFVLGIGVTLAVLVALAHLLATELEHWT